MKLARVLGTVICTHKDPNFTGKKLLVVQPVDSRLTPAGKKEVSVDTVDAGEGDLVMIVNGSSARRTGTSRTHPCDSAIIAIIDSVHADGQQTYLKAEDRT